MELVFNIILWLGLFAIIVIAIKSIINSYKEKKKRKEAIENHEQEENQEKGE